MELLGRALDSGVKLKKPLLKTYRRIARRRGRAGFMGHGYWEVEAEKSGAAINAGGVLPADWRD